MSTDTLPETAPSAAISDGDPGSPVLVFGLEERPPVLAALLAAVAHLLAIVASIMTAPLLIARGLGLNDAMTTYAIASALAVSGLATAVQILRPFGLGSGMLSIQGTSFTFIGPFVLAAGWLAADAQSMTAAGATSAAANGSAALLGTLLGTAVVGAGLTMIGGYYIEALQRVLTRRVTAVVIVLLGLTLVGTAWSNLEQAAGAEGAGSWVWLQAASVALTIAITSRLPGLWLRLSSIVLGLVVGVLVALATTGLNSAPAATEGPALTLWPYPLRIEWMILPLLLPIFLVSMTESVGDLTATSLLSRQPLSGPAYWSRIRGGVMADGANTILAAGFGTFPNTTFSQNNGVIQLTGVASRWVGLLVAGGLLAAAFVPGVAAGFQRLPDGVLYGATAVMFALIAVAGLRLLLLEANRGAALGMLAVCAVLAYGAAFVTGQASLPPALALITGYPVATGAVFALLYELLAGLLHRRSGHGPPHDQ
ncbi:MAG: solute carrier family 23 protein [Pseudomonadota bacterium]